MLTVMIFAPESGLFLLQEIAIMTAIIAKTFFINPEVAEGYKFNI
jgi:hypothetical protein